MAHETQVRVRYEETDQMGVVYHAKYLHYFEMGRTEALRDAGLRYRDLEDAGLMLTVTEVGVRYHASARYDDLLTIRSRVTGLGKARIRFDYEIFDEGRLLVTGHTVLASIDRDGRPKRLPVDVAKLAEGMRR
ncbi:MAG: thioesterase family protein [Planctomycetota bacterium]